MFPQFTGTGIYCYLSIITIVTQQFNIMTDKNISSFIKISYVQYHLFKKALISSNKMCQK